MCIGVPGKIIEIEENTTGVKLGKVSYGEVTRRVVLSIVPDVCVGDYVMVTSGIATSRLEKAEVDDLQKYLEEWNIP
jgi:hydrogenase expression/formation protein HypC